MNLLKRQGTKAQLILLLQLIMLTSPSPTLQSDFRTQQSNLSIKGVEKGDQFLLGSNACPGLLGCASCDADGNCLECLDQTRTVIQNNVCECQFTGASFRRDGTCGYCWVPGCKYCQLDGYISFTCIECDDSSTLVDGKCECNDGKHFFGVVDVGGQCIDCHVPLTNGYCSVCEADHCLYCPDGPCQACKDPQWAAEVNGECVCRFSILQLNEESYCTICLVYGCKTCKADFSESSQCVDCLDSTATINNGLCTCPPGQALKQDGYCYPCTGEQDLIYGVVCYKHCQYSLRCKTCIDGICTQCRDPNSILLFNECHCSENGAVERGDGYCGYCWVPGCLTCSYSNYFYSFQCVECIQGANLVDGKCLCPQGQYFVNGVCDTCYLYVFNQECRSCGMSSCQYCEGQTCLACTDPNYAQLVGGKCVCMNGFVFNEAGYCGRCNVIGCRSCEADQFSSSKCAECIDRSLPIVDGRCVCPEGQTIHEDGACYACNVYGCEVCAVDDTNVCEKCLGSPETIVNQQGQCQCLSKFKALNSKGECSFCVVKGCQTCSALNIFSCSTCIDWANTEISYGQCVCQRGQILNDDGYCQYCYISGCSSCKTGDSYVCERCRSGFYLQDGRCECTSLQKKINERGKCSKCSVSGCRSCFSFDASTCISCYDGAQLVQDQCLCEKGDEAPNEKGKCSSCLVSACLSCSSENPYQCLQCYPELELLGGICRCSGYLQKINVLGTCEACYVEGCQSCTVGNSSHCAKCMDCRAFLSEGLCSCPENFTWNLSSNQCTLTMIANQESDLVRQKSECPDNCEICDHGNCTRCSEPFYFRFQENICMRCNPRCRSCVDGASCIQYQQGWTTAMGKIVHCEVLHCADCLEAAQQCERCKQNYVLVDGFRCQVDPSHPDVDEDMGNFSEFKRKYRKVYESEEEEKKREQIYYRNYEEMKDMSKIVSFEVGENKFFDLTKQEMKGRSGYNPTTTGENKQKKLSTRVRSSLPTSLDWRTKGAVTHVKNQGACGSCWAFAAAAGAESALIIRKNATKAIDLSEQYLIECSLLSGCNGTGNLNEVMNLVLDGVPTEQSYPYDYRNTHPGICTTSNKLYIASSFIEEYQLKDEQIIDLLQDRPLIVGISSEGWNSYKGGIFQCNEDAQFDHAVVLVGYTEHYWIIKNSWGEDWGESGYIRITRSRYYNCLIHRELKALVGGPCAVPGCTHCEQDIHYCSGCHHTAVLYNGACSCQQAGYVFSPQQACVPCQVMGCHRCNISDPLQCEVCEDSMVLSVNGSCQCANPSHKLTKQSVCVLCEVLGCELCQSGKQNICIKCSDCSAYLHEGKCVCKEGYVMNSQGECIRRACLYPSVVENGVCKCPASFVQIGQSCRNCSQYGCVKCSSLDQINVKCETCEEGKGLEDGACVACGYGAKKYGEVCVQCLVQGCAFCALDNVCEQCLPGWVSKQNICVECPPGQYEAHGICSSCHPNCAQCRKYASSCTACAQGKYLFASACISCRHGCSYCSPLNPTICLSCADGYFLDRNLCYQCPKGCSTCSSDYNCSSCAAPYVLSGISCIIPCVFPCWTCQQDTPTSCLSCFDGYKLESSSCVLDVSCNDTSTCTGCSPTYYLTQEGKCQSCPQYCRTCPNQVCSQCVEGFDLFAQECVKEGSYSFKGNEQLSKQINTNPRLKRKFQQILKSK